MARKRAKKKAAAKKPDSPNDEGSEGEGGSADGSPAELGEQPEPKIRRTFRLEPLKRGGPLPERNLLLSWGEKTISLHQSNVRGEEIDPAKERTHTTDNAALAGFLAAQEHVVEVER